MSQKQIHAQIEAMPAGYKKELAKYMDKVYQSEFGEWNADPRYDLLQQTVWVAPPNGATTFSSGESIEESQHNILDALSKRAGGWFYVINGTLIFVTLEEWERVKAGEREP